MTLQEMYDSIVEMQVRRPEVDFVAKSIERATRWFGASVEHGEISQFDRGDKLQVDIPLDMLTRSSAAVSVQARFSYAKSGSPKSVDLILFLSNHPQEMIAKGLRLGRMGNSVDYKIRVAMEKTMKSLGFKMWQR